MMISDLLDQQQWITWILGVFFSSKRSESRNQKFCAFIFGDDKSLYIY